MMSSVMSGNEKVLWLRKRPKETSSKAKTARAPFGRDAVKELLIPAIVDGYNYHMGAVDEFNHLIAQNAGLRHVRRGGAQALEHWLLCIVLVNSYLLALCSDVPEPRPISFRSQQDFRRQLVGALLAMEKDSDISPKRGISRISQEANQVAAQSHEKIKMVKRGECVSYKGLRFRDWPKKRVALGEIAANQKRESRRTDTWYGCKQCNVHICRKSGCFEAFHIE
jgi:hypothetical protein